ncbi:restriction endonuclease [Streptomyces sp. SPB074]|uniref:restriction endonuclease n=1 Tax=Streptomyces sp. (strain SPB074) TaxID=465543 RepID=UPI00017F2466|nr:restriction endonuclease [Streptomyces sp. SPB074]EDY45637.1 translation initiation factor IF-2 [Streptomyces sp. SPB074]
MAFGRRQPTGVRTRATLLALALATALVAAVALLFLRLAHWAGAHPGQAIAATLLALPLLYALVRGMPRARELRRAARAGMAEADAEFLAAEPTVVLAPTGPQDGRTLPLTEPSPGLSARTTDLTALAPDAFEEAVADLCRRDGCRDVEVVGGAGDLGADALATAPDGRRVVIQCKRYAPTHKAGSQDLQRFGGTCWTVHAAQLALVVTTSTFTDPAAEYAEACGIRLIDGAALDAWTTGASAAPWGPARVG